MSEEQESLEQIKAELLSLKEKVENAYSEQKRNNNEQIKEDLSKLENDQTEEGKARRRNLFLKLTNFKKGTKENFTIITKYYENQNLYIELLEKELEKCKGQAPINGQNNQNNQPIQKDPSKEEFDNPNQKQNDDQQGKMQPNQGDFKQPINSDKKDQIISQLQQELENKNRDLFEASNLKQLNQELEQTLQYLQNENDKLKYQMTQRLESFDEISRLKEEIQNLKIDNQYYRNQQEALKQKVEESEGLLEYIVAENSRLIIKSFGNQDTKYKF